MHTSVRDDTCQPFKYTNRNNDVVEIVETGRIGKTGQICKKRKIARFRQIDLTG